VHRPESGEKPIVGHLEAFGILFVDVGMGVVATAPR
jgi:hypothetical protein